MCSSVLRWRLGLSFAVAPALAGGCAVQDTCRLLGSYGIVWARNGGMHFSQLWETLGRVYVAVWHSSSVLGMGVPRGQCCAIFTVDTMQ